MRFRTVILGCAVLGAAGCLSTEPLPPLELRLEVVGAAVSPGAPVGVNVIGRNRTGKFVSTPDPQSYCPAFAFQVRNESDVVVGPANADACLLATFAPVQVAPGDSVVISAQWDGRGLNKAQLPDGSYHIVAHITADGRELFSQAITVTHKSAP